MMTFLAKRLFDLTFVIVSLPILIPVGLILYFVVRIKLGHPAIFKQIRPGIHGKPFTMLKFRSMTDERDEKGALLPDERRLTGFGKLLRSTSLDELPELINVLKGEMSLVGPRPLLMEYLPRYNPEQFKRHEALPGITGLAQISGRNELEWEKRFQLDIYYVENQNLLMDLKILILTVFKVIKRDGISSKTSSTMEEFKGK